MNGVQQVYPGHVCTCNRLSNMFASGRDVILLACLQALTKGLAS
jgi:hypothetical protein